MSDNMELDSVDQETTSKPTKSGNDGAQVTQVLEVDEKQPLPTNTSEALQQWNKPRINLYRYLATLLGFIIMGMNDAAYGVGYLLKLKTILLTSFRL